MQLKVVLGAWKGMLFAERFYRSCNLGKVEVVLGVWKGVPYAKMLCRGCNLGKVEIVLSAWKGMPYAKRLCQGYNLGEVEDEKHLFLIYPNTQKVKVCFCSALPLTHTSILIEFLQTTNTVALAKFVICCQYPKDNLSSMIYLSSNGLFGPKWT
jgi:hypothetical protein